MTMAAGTRKIQRRYAAEWSLSMKRLLGYMGEYKKGRVSCYKRCRQAGFHYASAVQLCVSRLRIYHDETK